jgi:GNAT superfamily N-acetyltransferase
MGSLGKLFTYVKTGRLDKIGDAIAERIPWWLFHRGKASLYELRRVDQMTTKPGTVLPQGYVCRIAAREEMPACSRITGIDVREYYRRFDAGDICYGVFAEDKPLNINWVHSGACYVRGMGYTHDGAARDKYVYGIMTDPAERGKGLYKSCLVNLAKYLFENGAERIIQMVEEGNAPVLATLPQLGYKKTYEIRHITLCGVKRTVVIDLNIDHTAARWFMSEPNDRFVL